MAGYIGKSQSVSLSSVSTGTVETQDIQDGAVTNVKVASGVDAGKLTTGTLPIARIADGAITDAKIDGMSSSKLSGALPAIDGSALTGIAAGGGLQSMQVFTSSGTWTKPTGINLVKVYVTGGGGAGWGGDGSYGGGGGASGGTAIKIIDVSAISSVSVTVGAGGTATNSTGNPGGTSSFGSHCSATGGGGGVSSYGGGFYPPEGGVGSNGDINLHGNGSDIGRLDNYAGGNGQGSFWGGGGRGPRNDPTYEHGGEAWHGGGSGGANDGGFTNDGGDGIVVVEEYK